MIDRFDFNSSYFINKKIYTRQQIFDNVESIQKHYEQILETSIKSSTSCFSTLKQMIKSLKNFHSILRNKTIEQTSKSIQMENKSPFIFGGDTLQWIALPQSNNVIYENDLIY